MREEPLHVHVALGDELGALGLALLRERPRPHQRDPPAQEIRADVERDLTPLADETGGATRRTGGVSISARCGGAWVETDDRKGSSAHRQAPLTHPRVVGAYVRKGRQVIAGAVWGIGPMGRTHEGPYGTHEEPYGIARVRLRRVVAGIVRRAIAVI